MGDWTAVLVGGVPADGGSALGDWQLARALARRRRVLYIDPPSYPRTVIRNRDPRLLWPRMRPVAPGLVAFRPVAPPGANRPWGVDLGDRVIGMQAGQAAARLPGSHILLTFDPKRGALPQIERELLVYWRRDRLASSANTAQPDLVRRRDLALMRDADLVTGVSPPLVEEAATLGARSVLVPNGCDYAHFATAAPRPADFPDTGPVIGFAGGVSWRLDLDLLVGVAERRPPWTLLLAGEQTIEVPDRPNIVRVGAQPYEQLPGWLQRFDVGIIPYRRDSFNLAAAPLKVYEYLAAGIPVVSTNLPAVPSVPGLIATADTTDAFVVAIERALDEPPDIQDCRALARNNDWDARADMLEGHIDQLLETRPDPRR